MKKKLLTGLLMSLMFVGMVGMANASTYQIVVDETAFDGASGWYAARLAAQNLGSGWDLASITSQEENDLIASLLGSSNNDYRDEYYIGAYRVSGSTFAWVSNDPWIYSNWWSGEPNGDGVGAAMDWRGSWAWNDEGSAPYQITGFIAEYNQSVPEPATLFLLGAGLVGLGFSRKRMK